jgi:small subunit ribosomal protein S11
MAADKKAQTEKTKAEKAKVEKTEGGKKAPVKKKTKKIVTEGVFHVHASFNNTIINVTDHNGNSLTQHSAGAAGFTGSRKHTPHAAQVAAEEAARRAKEDFRMESAEVLVGGAGPGRDSAVRAINASGIEVKTIKDNTPIPHNGCRPPKRRRV